MSKQVIVVPDLAPSAPYVHAVRAGDVLITSAMAPVDRAGRIAAKGFAAQTRKCLENLGRVLDAAGAEWTDVARVNCYVAPPGPNAAERKAMIAALGAFLAPGRQAGLEVCFGMADRAQRLAIELTAHIGAAKSVIPAGKGSGVAPHWAAAVRAGRSVYLSARRAGGAARGGGPRLAQETRAIYARFDALLRQAGVAWSDLVRVHQFINDTSIRFDEVRQGRAEFVPIGRFLSTSLACGRPDPGGLAENWLIASDLEASTAPKVCLTTNDVVDTPGVVHAIRTGALVHFQAQTAADPTGATLYPDDIEGQAHQIFSSLDRMLKAAGLGWPDLVHCRLYCKRARDFSRVRAIHAQWAGRTDHALAELVGNFFDPTVLLEVEIAAAARG